MALVATVLAVVLAGASCSDPAPVSRAANAPGTVAPLAALAGDLESGMSILTIPDGFVLDDTRAVELPVVSTVPNDAAIPVFGGEARISGQIRGPDGPVEGATVRIERFVDGRGGYSDLTTNEDGMYYAEGLLGGHLRVRSWLEPDLTALEPQTLFLVAKGQRTIDVAVSKQDVNHLQAALDRGDPHVDEMSVLRVMWLNEEVRKEDGIIEGAGIPDVKVGVGPKEHENWEVFENDLPTNEDGYVEFFMVCKAEGAWPMLVATPEIQIEVTLPECLPKREQPEDTTPGSTSTTVEGEDEEIPAFAVGRSFTVPADGPVPAGTYLSQAEKTCATEFEILFDGEWERRQVTGATIDSRFPMRRFRTITGVPPCTFTRTR